MYDKDKEEYFIYETCELDPFAPSTTEDPFLKKLAKLCNSERIFYINVILIQNL